MFKLPSRAVMAFLTAGLPVAACHPAGAPTPSGDATRAAVETVTVRDPELEQRTAKAEMRLLEKDAQIEDLQNRLEEARREVVRALAKLETTASRAEAASAMAEAEVAVQSFKAAGGGGTSPPPEAVQSRHLLDESSTEFNNQNYGGALYLANQAKSVASAGQGRLQSGDRQPLRAGETPFAVPVPLQAVGRSNVREGPGPNFKIAFTVESGAALTGYSFMSDWIRVVDDSGRSGWIARSRIAAQKSD